MCFSWCIPEGKVYGVALFSPFFTALSPKQTEVDTKMEGGGEAADPSLLGNSHSPILAGYHTNGHFGSA